LQRFARQRKPLSAGWPQPRRNEIAA